MPKLIIIMMILITKYNSEQGEVFLNPDDLIEIDPNISDDELIGSDVSLNSFNSNGLIEEVTEFNAINFEN